MAIIKYPNDDTTKAVIAAIDAGNVAVGWQLQAIAGVVYNPALTTTPKLFPCPNVAATLAAINSTTSILVLNGPNGMGYAAGIKASTVPSTIVDGSMNQGTTADDFIAHSVLGQITFDSSSTFHVN